MNILFVSIAFPPKKDPECVQTARYFKYLSERKDLSVEVLTTDSPTLFMPDDDLLKKYDQGWTSKVKLQILENKYLSFLLRHIGIAFNNFPDPKAHFHKQWKRAIRKLKQKPEAIYSRSNPLSSTFMAFKLVEHFMVPWVLHLSDPWVDSPLHTYSEKQKVKHTIWEEKCFSKASIICLTSLKSIEFYTKKYPSYADKIKFYPNVYDPEDILDNKHRKGDKLRIVYTGGLAGSRSPKPFLDALRQFNLIEPNHSNLEVIFAGPTDRKMQTVLDDFTLSNFTYKGNLSFQESLHLQKSADVLLVIDSFLQKPELSMFFPSKILEYLAAGRRIFALTTEHSSTQQVLDDLGLDSIELKESKQIVDYLRGLLKEFNEGNSEYFILREVPKEYDARYNAERLYKQLKSL